LTAYLNACRGMKPVDARKSRQVAVITVYGRGESANLYAGGACRCE
jgi:hypothetical protein